MAGTTPSVATGHVVRLGRDQSGNGYDLQLPVNAVGLNPPTLTLNSVNGLPAITGDGITQAIYNLTLNVSQPYAIFTVINSPLAFDPDHTMAGWADQSGTTFLSPQAYGEGEWDVGVIGISNISDGDLIFRSVPRNTFGLVTCYLNAENSYAQWNNGTKGTPGGFFQTGSITGGLTLFDFGGVDTSGPNVPFQGQIARVLVYQAPTAQQITQIKAWLNSIYNLY